MPRQRVRHEPEQTVLYQVIREHLPGFLQSIEADGSRSPLPRFVVRELRAFLECGLLCFGFCRVHCSTCKKDELVAFSCKKRGFCPSCGARRMAETAAHLVDHVLPDVPYRQWVLSLPYRIRFLCAYDPICASGVRRILTRTISRHYEERARALGVVAPRSGAVVFAQRFDSALRLNLHYHGIWADGTFTCEFAKPRASFFALSQPTDKDVALLVTTIRKRVLRLLKKRGKLPYDSDAAQVDPPETLEILGAAAVQGRIPFGPHAGAFDRRPGRGTTDHQPPRTPQPLCASMDGFSLHAQVRIGDGHRERLEKLLRYAARPPICHSRMARAQNGNVLYSLKKTWRDGSTHVVLEPYTLLARLAALIPTPNKKPVTYRGVFASAAGYRAWVVPPPPEAESQQPPKTTPLPDPRPPAPALEHHEPGPLARHSASAIPAKPRLRKPRAKWAELLKRVYLIDVLTCPCGGMRSLIAAITHHEAIVKILDHLGLPSERPQVTPARAPPHRADDGMTEG